MSSVSPPVTLLILCWYLAVTSVIPPDTSRGGCESPHWQARYQAVSANSVADTMLIPGQSIAALGIAGFWYQVTANFPYKTFYFTKSPSDPLLILKMFPRLFWWYRDTKMAETVAALGFEAVSARYQQAILLIPADTKVIPICRNCIASLWHNWYQDGISAVAARYHRWYRVGSCQVGPHVWVRTESDACLDVAESTGGTPLSIGLSITCMDSIAPDCLVCYAYCR